MNNFYRFFFLYTLPLTVVFLSMNTRYCFRSEAKIAIFDQEMFPLAPILEGLDGVKCLAINVHIY